jgi:hypothetical protein
VRHGRTGLPNREEGQPDKSLNASKTFRVALSDGKARPSREASLDPALPLAWQLPGRAVRIFAQVRAIPLSRWEYARGPC